MHQAQDSALSAQDQLFIQERVIDMAVIRDHTGYADISDDRYRIVHQIQDQAVPILLNFLTNWEGLDQTIMNRLVRLKEEYRERLDEIQMIAVDLLYTMGTSASLTALEQTREQPDLAPSVRSAVAVVLEDTEEIDLKDTVM